MMFLKKWLLRCKRLAVILVKLVCAILVLSGIVLAVGLIPVNNDFEEAKDGVTIYVVSNSVHAEIIVPIKHDQYSWRDFFAGTDYQKNLDGNKFVGLGWGDKKFFIETPTWDEFKSSTALKALLIPSKTAVHVSVFNLEKEMWPEARAITISHDQYLKLVRFLESSFAMENAKPLPINGSGYYEDDIFFEGNGTYFAFNTCNSWVGRGLQTAGVRVAWLTPLPGSMFLYLPD